MSGDQPQLKESPVAPIPPLGDIPTNAVVTTMAIALAVGIVIIEWGFQEELNEFGRVTIYSIWVALLFPVAAVIGLPIWALGKSLARGVRLSFRPFYVTGLVLALLGGFGARFEALKREKNQIAEWQKEAAIEIAKRATTIHPDAENDRAIHDFLRRDYPNAQLIGWRASEPTNGIFPVTFEWVDGANHMNWAFRVNPDLHTVQLVTNR